MPVPAAIGFGIAVLPICLTPGVSFSLVTQRVISRGRTAGVRVIAGTAAGLACHAFLAAVGLAALVMRSSEAFTAVKLVGAAYLVWLGVTTVRRAGTRADRVDPATRTLPWAGRGDVLQGFLGNVLNPKAAAVYLTLAPQFLHADQPVLPQMAVLLCAHIVVATAWLLAWTAFVHSARVVFARREVRRRVDQVTGVVLVGLGVRAAAVR